MHPSGIFSAIVVGLIIGAVGRLIIPGRNPIGTLLTIVVGLVAAFIGGAIGYQGGLSFITTLIIQVALAALLVLLVGGGMRGRARR